jgi:hypothetical protein
MDMRRRVIERVDPCLESLFTNYRRHIIPNALGFINLLPFPSQSARRNATRSAFSCSVRPMLNRVS